MEPFFRHAASAAALALAQARPAGTVATGAAASNYETVGPFTISRTTLELASRVGSSLITVAVALALLRLLPVLERYVIRWAKKSAGDRPSATESQIDQHQRVETLTRVVGSIATAVIWTTTVIVVLGNLGINIGPLIAGAGIAGVAVGFGAQSIVKDFFAGFFILLENQYDVGDQVTIAGVSGTVERMTMRITVVRDAVGTLHYIPNSNVGNVANKASGWNRASVDVTFAATVAVDDARALLEAAAKRASESPELEGALSEDVLVEGPIEFAPAGVTWRLVARAIPSRVVAAKRVLIAALTQELRAGSYANEGGALTVKKAS